MDKLSHLVLHDHYGLYETILEGWYHYCDESMMQSLIVGRFSTLPPVSLPTVLRLRHCQYGGPAGWVSPVQAETQAHRLRQLGLELVEPCGRGLHGGKRDVSSLDVNRHGDLFYLQVFREGCLLVVVLDTHVPVALVCETPRLAVSPKDAFILVLVLEVEALVGHGDVPGTLRQHLPGVDAHGEAVNGQHLRGFGEACGFTGVVHPGGHSFHCFQVVRDSEVLVHSLLIQPAKSCLTNI